MRASNSQVDAIFAEWDRKDSPGCALGVIRDGDLVYGRGYGMANLEYGIRITTGSVFHVASVSKQFTAMSLVLLAQEGRISLDDDVRTYIPELPDYGRPITLRHLIHHTSGLRDQWDLLYLAGWRQEDLKTDDDVLALASRQRSLNFVPGEEHLYCNTGYTLMGIVVKRVIGQSLREFTDERLFRPLRMKDTHFHDDPSMVVKRRAYAYEPREGGGFRISIPVFATVGASSLFTTVRDLARWERNYFEARVGGAAGIEQMHAPGVLNSGEALDYAFALVVGSYRGLRTAEHSGGDAGYRSHLLRFLDARLSVAILCNVPMDPRRLAYGVADLYLAEIMEELPEAGAAGEAGAGVETEDEAAAPSLSEAEVAGRIGPYWNPITEETRELLFQDGVLMLKDGERAVALRPVEDGRFAAVGRPLVVRFEPSQGGPSEAGLSGDRMLLEEGGRTFLYEPVPPAPEATDHYEEYEGAYYSEDLDIHYHLLPGEGQLMLRHYKIGPEPLVPVYADAFNGDHGRLRFTRDADGRVIGFTLTTGRSRRIRFDRR